MDDRWERHPSVTALTLALEDYFEAALRVDHERTADPGVLDPDPALVEDRLWDLARSDGGPSLSARVAEDASLDQVRELAVHRSAYERKEADPHSWAIPRLSGRAKAALIEIQADEYGGGVPGESHAELFAATVVALGLDPTYGRYLDRIPAVTLATTNLISLLGRQRRLRGALAGHLALFEMTSVGPMGRYAAGLRRLGVGGTRFYDVHVEADAHHQHVAAHDLAQALVDAELHLAAGELSYSKVRAITRVAVEPYEEEFFVNFARHSTAPKLEEAVSGYRRSGCLDDQDAADRHQRRRFRWWVEPDGMIAFEGRMAPEDAAIVTAAIGAATVLASKRSTERPVDDQGQPLPQPGDDSKWARQADALVAICDRALHGDDDRPGLVADPAATIVVHTDDGVLENDADGACRLDGGPNLAPETARRLACDSTTFTIATGPDGTPRLVDKAHKSVSRTLRREVAARDQGHCRFPGCDLLGRFQVHHIVHQEHGGAHRVDNLITLCAFHHRLVHERGYRIELLLGQVTVHRPGTTPVTNQPTTAPTGSDLRTLHDLAELTIADETITGHWDGTRLRHDDLSWAIAFLHTQRTPTDPTNN